MACSAGGSAADPEGFAGAAGVDTRSLLGAGVGWSTAMDRASACRGQCVACGWAGSCQFGLHEDPHMRLCIQIVISNCCSSAFSTMVSLPSDGPAAGVGSLPSPPPVAAAAACAATACRVRSFSMDMRSARACVIEWHGCLGHLHRHLPRGYGVERGGADCQGRCSTARSGPARRWRIVCSLHTMQRLANAQAPCLPSGQPRRVQARFIRQRNICVVRAATTVAYEAKPVAGTKADDLAVNGEVEESRLMGRGPVVKLSWTRRAC